MESQFIDFFNSVLYDLCDRYPCVLPYVHPIWEKQHRSTSAEYVWNEASLKKVLEAIAGQTEVTGTCLLFVDGLDECQTPQGDLIRYMKKLTKAFRGQRLKLKICAASRPETDIINLLRSQEGFAYEDHTPAGIEHYAASKLKEAIVDAGWEVEDDPSLQYLVKSLVLNSNGVWGSPCC